MACRLRVRGRLRAMSATTGARRVALDGEREVVRKVGRLRRYS
jgi:hypothetical protein